MKTSHVLALAASYAAGVTAVTGQLGDAVPVLDNPVGVAYEAAFEKDGLKGRVVALSEPTGVKFDVNIVGLPTEGGPFLYHIHVDPVPASGNCTLTLAHLDPYIRGETDPCDPTQPATCQVGDLSGKHGKINGTSLNQTYIDPYPALKPGIGAFFGNRSIVVHFANKTRIACANFTMIEREMYGEGMPYGSANGTWSASMMPSSSSSASASASTGAAMTTSFAYSSAAIPTPTASSTKTSPPLQTTNAADRLGMLPLGPTAGCAALAMAMGWFML